MRHLPMYHSFSFTTSSCPLQQQHGHYHYPFQHQHGHYHYSSTSGGHTLLTQITHDYQHC